MLKTRTEVETRRVTVVDEIICNKCSKNTIGKDHVEISVSWGYYSSKDGVVQTAHLCEDCWDSFCSTFEVQVEGYSTLWSCAVDPEGNPIEDVTVPEQLSLFTEDQLSGDPARVVSRCRNLAFIGGVGIRGYSPCTRAEGHEGPCAHPLSEQ